MKKNIVSILFVVLAFLISCNIAKKESNTKKESIAFIEGKNYFVRNDYPDKNLHFIKITKQEDFDKCLGIGMTMNAEPVKSIDFNKQFAVIIIHEITDKSTVLEIKDVFKSKNQIIINYKLFVGEQQSFTIRPVKVLIFDNKNEGKIVLNLSK